MTQNIKMTNVNSVRHENEANLGEMDKEIEAGIGGDRKLDSLTTQFSLIVK